MIGVLSFGGAAGVLGASTTGDVGAVSDVSGDGDGVIVISVGTGTDSDQTQWRTPHSSDVGDGDSDPHGGDHHGDHARLFSPSSSVTDSVLEGHGHGHSHGLGTVVEGEGHGYTLLQSPQQVRRDDSSLPQSSAWKALYARGEVPHVRVVLPLDVAATAHRSSPNTRGSL
jgi:hypothetical protein